MMGRTGADGALLLRAMRTEDGQVSTSASEAPRTDDLLPIEMLVARVQATRSQTMLFEKLIDLNVSPVSDSWPATSPSN